MDRCMYVCMGGWVSAARWPLRLAFHTCRKVKVKVKEEKVNGCTIPVVIQGRHAERGNSDLAIRTDPSAY